MGNLSNLYISQSYQSLIHLGNDSTVTSTPVVLQDGLGNSIGVSVNNAGDVSLTGTFSASLEEGYAWVGDASNRTKLVSTASFGGASDLSSLNAFTASQDSKNSTLATYTGSNDTKWNTLGGQTGSWVNVPLDSLNAFTQSQETKNSTLATYTASVNSDLSSIHAYTASNDTKWNTLGSQTGSWVNVPLDSLNAFTASQETKNSTLATYTGSIDTKFSTLSSVTSSLIISSSNLETSASLYNAKFTNIGSQSGSWDNTNLNAFTASQETKNTTLGGVTASLQQQLTNIGSQSGSWVTESETGSFARTDVSNTFTTSQTIQGGLNVTGTITANEIHTIIESSSVIFSSGSNILGDAASDTQTLNGSVNVVNQLTASGLHYPTADNGAESFIQTNGAGTLSLQYVKTIYQNIRNMETSSLVKGTPLFASGSTGDNVNVYIADATNPNRMPATLIAGDTTLAPSATGKGIIFGHIEGVNTTGYPAGTAVYVGAGGGWSATRPTGSTTPVQPLGVVTREGINGMGVVMTETPNSLPNIQTGYAWVGNGSSYPTAVPTSSFASLTDLSSLNAFTASQETKNNTLGLYTASVDTQLTNLSTSQSIDNAKWVNISSQSGSWGQTINTGSFATTGSNTFNGTQTITNGGLDIVSNGGSITLQSNAQGSGSAFVGITAKVDITTDPTQVYSPIQLVDETGNALIAMAAISYTPQYPSTPIPMIYGGGNNPDASNAAIAFPANGDMDVWKKSNFAYGVDVTGSLKNNGSQVVTSNQTGSFIQDLTSLNAFTASQETKNSTLASYTQSVDTQLTNLSTSQSIDNQKWINISSQSGSWGGGSINTGSFATTGSNVFDGGQTIFNGGLSIQGNAQGSGSAFAIGGGIVDTVSDPTNVYSAWQLSKPSGEGGDTLVGLAVTSYAPQYSGITYPMILAAGNNPGGNNAAIIWKTDGTAEHWKKSDFKYGVDVTGSLKVTSTLTASLQEGYVWAGGAGNVSKLVATSSFGGGGAAFPYSGTASISGSLQVTGSMSGLPNELSVSSNTASIDFTKGNFFSITLPASATTHFVVSNSIKGQTVNIQINQPAGASTGSVAFAPSILFAGGNDYQATATGSAIDLLTLVSITGSSVLATSIKNFQ